MSKVKSKKLVIIDSTYKEPSNAQAVMVQIGNGFSVPLYASSDAEELAMRNGAKVLKAFRLEKNARELIDVYEKHGYAVTLQRLEALKLTPELVLALLLQRSGEKSVVAAKNAKSKPEKFGRQALQEEATREYLSCKPKRSKDAFSQDFSLMLEQRMLAALGALAIAREALNAEKKRQAEPGARFRSRASNSTKLKDLQAKFDAAKQRTSFKVYSASTIRDVWLKGL